MAESKADIIDGVRSGDERAFRELHRQYWAGMVKTAAQVLPADLAKDAVQDVMFLVWRNRSTWNVHVDSLDSYLHRAARNRALEIARKEKLAEHPPSDYVTPQRIPDPERQLVNTELGVVMRHAIDDLSPRSREAFVLSREGGMSHSEVATRMRVSTETVKTQLKRATAALRKALSGCADDK